MNSLLVSLLTPRLVSGADDRTDRIWIDIPLTQFGGSSLLDYVAYLDRCAN